MQNLLETVSSSVLLLNNTLTTPESELSETWSVAVIVSSNETQSVQNGTIKRFAICYTIIGVVLTFEWIIRFGFRIWLERCTYQAQVFRMATFIVLHELFNSSFSRYCAVHRTEAAIIAVSANAIIKSLAMLTHATDHHLCVISHVCINTFCTAKWFPCTSIDDYMLVVHIVCEFCGTFITVVWINSEKNIKCHFEYKSKA